MLGERWSETNQDLELRPVWTFIVVPLLVDSGNTEHVQAEAPSPLPNRVKGMHDAILFVCFLADLCWKPP